jgi:hypothetical protein
MEHQLAVGLALTCGNFEHAQISSQVEATCYKLARLAIRLNGTNASYRKLPQVNLRSRLNVVSFAGVLSVGPTCKGG